MQMVEPCQELPHDVHSLCDVEMALLQDVVVQLALLAEFRNDLDVVFPLLHIDLIDYVWGLYLFENFYFILDGPHGNIQFE